MQNQSVPPNLIEMQINAAYNRLLVATRPQDQLQLLDKLRRLLRQRQREGSTDLLRVLQ